MAEKVVALSERRPRKKTAISFCIQLTPVYKESLFQGFRGTAAAEFFRQHTAELWEPPFCNLTIAEYGAFRKIIAMFARSKDALQSNMIVVTAKELRMHGITPRILKQVGTKMKHLQISLLSESGEIIDLDGN